MLRRYELVVRVLVVAFIGAALATLGGVNAVVAQDVRLAQDARAIAQTGNGVLKGKVVDSETAEGLIGATVRVLGTRYGANTNLDGDFQIDALPVGKYKLSVNYVGYQADSFNIEIKANVGTIIEIKLLPQGMSVATVQIVADRSTISSTDVSVLNEVRSARVSASGVSSIQISRSLDRDAADVVKRVPGVTIQGDRFVVVRGLAERYNSVYLNNVQAPSADADKRSFSFDLIPSNLIDRLLIFKTPAPELPGDFSGGAVKIFTKNASDSRQIVFSIGSSYRSGTTGKSDFMSSSGSSTDWLGYDGGTRKAPSGLPRDLSGASITDQINAGRRFRNEWVPTQNAASPDYKIGLNYYDSWKVFGKKLRNLTSINYSRSFEHYAIDRKDLEPSGTISYNYSDVQSTDGVRIGLLQNFSLALNENNRIEWKNFFNQLGTDQATRRFGQQSGGLPTYAYALYYRSRTLLSSQLSGVHDIGEGLQVDWYGGFNYTSRQEPDFRRIELREGAPGSSDPNSYTRVFIQPGTINPRLSTRFFSSLYERSYTGGANTEKKWDGGWVVRVGGTYTGSERTFSARLFGVSNTLSFDQSLRDQRPQVVYAAQNFRADGTGYLMSELSRPDNAYTASSDLIAGYGALNIPFLSERLNLYTGIRWEQYTQKIVALDQGGAPLNVNRPFAFLLPSANITYKLTSRFQIRGSYGRTVNRPEFRELAPFTFFDFDLQSLVLGNANLDQAYIDNIDLRFEYYPSLNEVFSIGAFFKQFNRPIENRIVLSNPDRNFRPVNAESAQAYGVEVEVRKGLGFVSEGSKFLNQLSVVFNGSYIQSEVKVDPNDLSQIENRPLQGQSPYIINGGIFWENEASGWQINALYNVFGNRIFAVGDRQGNLANNPTIFERPRNVIDLSITKKFGKSFEAKFGISDILNQPVRFFQDFNLNKVWNEGVDNEYFKFRPGQVYSLSLTYKIF